MEIPKLKALGKQRLKVETAKRQLQSIFGEELESDQEAQSAFIRDDRKRRTKNLDSFLEELRKADETKSVESKLEESHVATEPLLASTNVFVGNLPLDVSEADLLYDFGHFGPIASIKIMWPRTIEERERNFMNGFVAYMNVASAESALCSMDGKEWQGKRLHVAWSKPVVIPPKPFYVRPNMEPAKQKPPTTFVKIMQPENATLLATIHAAVEKVVGQGGQCEQHMMQETVDHPDYHFLRDVKSPDYHYYQWKKYSILHGDSFFDWHTRSIEMDPEQGLVYIPPAVPFREVGAKDEPSIGRHRFVSFGRDKSGRPDTMEGDNGESHHDCESDESDKNGESDESDEEEEGQGGGEHNGRVVVTMEQEYSQRHKPSLMKSLSRKNRQKYERSLRSLTSYRDNIANVMLFCIGHSEAAEEIVEILFQSLMIVETETRVKIARLYLLSDLLHNSNVTRTNAWKFRTAIESKLPELFVHLHMICVSAKSKLKSESIKRAALQLLMIWESWNVFPLTFFHLLRESFTMDRPIQQEEICKENLDGEPVDLDGEPVDLDGEPVDLDGEPVDLDGEPVDLDGEPVKLDDDNDRNDKNQS